MASCVVQKEAGFLLRNCHYALDARDIAEITHHKRSNQVLEEVSRNVDGVHLLNVVDKLCDESKCDNYVNNEFIHRDSNHLRLNLSADTLANLAGRLGLSAGIRTVLGADGPQPVAATAAVRVMMTPDGARADAR
jgi:hypothetical protein